MQAPSPYSRELVFIGGGHTHALVLRRWGMAPLPGARLTLINPGPTAPYTGMLPGFVAGHYARDDLSIDLVRLARFADARLILGVAEGLDLTNRRIHVAGRPPVAFDVASINIGITSDLPDLPGFLEHGIAAKPLGLYARRWLAFKASVARGEVVPCIAVIGGGIGGIELSLAMAHALRHANPEITVIDRNTALTGVARPVRRALLQEMRAYGITLLEQSSPERVAADHVLLTDGTRVPSCLTVGAAGARPHPWLAGTGLHHEDGFLSVDTKLRTSDRAIFAAGDCAHLPDPRPKAGVFAVREAPTLAHNLRMSVQGTGPLRRFTPQRDYLKLVSLGRASAVADKWGAKLQGPWVWRWKDWIDRRFMDSFTHLPPMPRPAVPRPAAAGMRDAMGPKPLCGGCGAKVASNTLRDVLARMPAAKRSDVTWLQGDDAAEIRFGDARQVVTTDHLRAFHADPFEMARIAATHALGDIWAMGAAPQAALAQVTLPRMAPKPQAAWLDEIMAGAAEVFADAGAVIAGGHTSLGQELTLGFTVTGLASGAPIRTRGAREGDHLILTKPIGSGTLLAAEMSYAAQGGWMAAAYATMRQPQTEAAAILAGAHAMTDVTGFGLAGHLLNICQASDASAELWLDDVPLMEGALELAQAGIRSTLYPQNRAVLDHMTGLTSPITDLLFDPQTAGGLLAAVAEDDAATLIDHLHEAGYPAALIGRIGAGPAAIRVL